MDLGRSMVKRDGCFFIIIKLHDFHCYYYLALLLFYADDAMRGS